MFSKSNLISTIVTFLWAFFGGYLLWGMLVDPFLQEHLGSATGVSKEAPEFVPLAIGCLIVAFAFSTIFSKWSRGSHSASQGAEFGIWVGILIGFGDGIINLGVMNVLDLTGALVNGVTYVVFFLIMGVLASIVYNKTSS